MPREILVNGSQALAQFRSIQPIASVPETAEPLVTMGLIYRAPCSDHLPTLAAPIARRTHVIQPATGWGKVISLRKRALPGPFPRAVDVKHHPVLTGSIHQTPSLRGLG